jgi:aminoacyl tRNA synthase complex-interacting multifunctional protein 1
MGLIFVELNSSCILSLSSNKTTGLDTFLQGDVVDEPEVDIRGTEVFDEIVSSKEELEQLMASKSSGIVANSVDDNIAAAAVAAAPAKDTTDSVKKSTPVSDTIDISKLDIRVGVITKAWEHEEAEKLFCEEIDIGEESPRLIASGLRQYYNVDQLPGQRVLVLANLKERKLVGFPSHGMVLCASSNDGSSVQFVEPPATAAIGERIYVNGYDGEPATENQILKKKILDKVFPDLQTNDNGIACYKGEPLSTTAGPCTSSIPNSKVA